MAEWLAAATVLLGFIFAMPAIYRALRRSAAREGWRPLALALGVTFSNLLDPAKRQATEEIDRRRNIAASRRRNGRSPPGEQGLHPS
jgi:hypothetical protein